MGLFDSFKKIRDGLAKTRSAVVDRISKAISDKTKIDDEVISRVEDILLASDVGFEATERIIQDIKNRIKLEGYDGSEKLKEILKDEISRSLIEPDREKGETIKPYVIMVVGVNGAGKTTTVGKLAHLYRSSGKKVLIAAADTFRAAANEQLSIWAERTGVEILQQQHGADPGAVAYDAVRAAVAREVDVVLIDTAGRLHTKTNLMEELKKIRRVIQKVIENAPHEVLLVLDAVTGQNGLVQARKFMEAVGVNGIVLTKLDGTAKGGIVIAINQELRLPVKFIGVGEGVDDLQPFDKKMFVAALFGESFAG
ncbi:MAG: signal recognition particle-docking protein FtsY [Candidatus Kryptoniota bacterium]